MRKSRRVMLLSAMVATIAGSFYWLMLPGLSVADREPSQMETEVATWLLHQSVPEGEKLRANPLGPHPDQAAIVAGRDVFQQKCEICHGYAGDGKTEIGAGVYPRPPALRDVVSGMPDGEIFYHIRNGIRNTAMPAWRLPDAQLWQLVAYVRNLPGVAPLSPSPAQVAQTAPVPNAHFVGSAQCRSCHQEVYDRWSKSRMANVVRDPKQHPEVVIPDLTKSEPPVKFTIDQVALVYGSKWKQRYFTKIGDDYFPLPVQWDVSHKMWRPYMVPNDADWWAPMYPPDNMLRPTGPLCDGCHSVNYDVKTKTVTEWNVGCERCHGAGSEHVSRPARDNILNPARMNFVQANDTCIQCHSQGRPVNAKVDGRYYDWPVGFHQGLNLADFWNLEEHKLGELTFTHFPDGTAHKNRMQGNDFVQSLMYARGVTCFSCHDPHGSENDAALRKPVKEICLTCHGPNTQNGPHAASIEAHTHHKAGSTGSECVNCHMPKIEQTIADQNVRAHTFRFITPADTERQKIPNACNDCHRDKSTGWAIAALKSWTDRSPWRVTP